MVVACVFSTVAHLVLSRRSHPVGWLSALTGVGGGLAAVAFLGEVWWLEAHPTLSYEDVPAWLGRGNSTAWVPGTMALFLVVPWLVRDHPMRWFERVGTGLGVLVVVAMTTGGLLGLDPLVGVGLVASVPLGLVSAAAVELRRRRGPEAERNGLGWLALGTLVMALSFVPLLVPVGGGDGYVWVTPVLHLVSQALFPAAILVAVLRGRMWDLDLAVSRATVAAVMTVLLLALYVAVAVALGRLVPGQGVAQAVAVRRLGAALGRGDEDLLPDLARRLGEAVRLASVRVVAEDRQTELARWVRPGAGPDPLLGPEEVTLEHRGVVVGHLLVTVPPGEAVAARDRRVLAARSGGEGMAVEADVADVADHGELPAGVAAAAYGIAVEAVTNARRHARATRSLVRATTSGPVLRLLVEDDGVGLPEQAVPGVGTRSMQERAEEVGGRAEVVGRPGEGTLVDVVLPLRGADAPVTEVAGA